MHSSLSWPIRPWTTGWRVKILIPLTPADRTALGWIRQQFPGGPTRDADVVQLMTE